MVAGPLGLTKHRISSCLPPQPTQDFNAQADRKGQTMACKLRVHSCSSPGNFPRPKNLYLDTSSLNTLLYF